MIPKYTKVLKEYLALDEHVQLKNRIKQFHRKRREPFMWPENVLGITVDSKEPEILGKGPDELSGRTFKYKTCNVFGLVTHHRLPNEANVTNTCTFSSHILISRVMNHKNLNLCRSQ